MSVSASLGVQDERPRTPIARTFLRGDDMVVGLSRLVSRRDTFLKCYEIGSRSSKRLPLLIFEPVLKLCKFQVLGEAHCKRYKRAADICICQGSYQGLRVTGE